ncbi:MAG TPA: hypothetical protein VEK34_16000 [Methylocella sp.]|nr:hypothetical protein [Methylocella sp.]
MSNPFRFDCCNSLVHDGPAVHVADAYNHAGGDYAAYADGDPTRLFVFDCLHAYADQ